MGSDEKISEKKFSLQSIQRGAYAPSFFNEHLNGITVSNVELVDSDVALPLPRNNFVKKIKVAYIGGGTAFSFDFGAIYIMESMAHIAQRFVFPSTIASDVPYKAAELIAKHIYPPIANNPLFVYSLCDISLMGYHPGQIFYMALIAMKEKASIHSANRKRYL